MAAISTPVIVVARAVRRCVRAVIFPAAWSAPCCRLARRSSKLKSGILSFAGIFGFDLIGEGAELVSLGFAEVCAVGLLEEEEELEDVIFGKKKVDNPCAAALSPPAECYPDLAQAAATDEQISALRVFQQLLLEGPILPVTHPFGDLAGEMRSFNERERHPERNTLYLFCVKG